MVTRKSRPTLMLTPEPRPIHNENHEVRTHHKLNDDIPPPPTASKYPCNSYANILKGNNNYPPKPKQTTLNIQLNFPTTSDHDSFTSVVAELKSINGATNTHNLILDEGFGDFSIKYLGGLFLLLQLPSHELATKILSNNTLNSHFKSLIPWNNDFRISERLTWIAISGLPPQIWFSETFSSIAKHWGQVIIPEDCNARQFNRTFGKVCILTKHQDFIKETVSIPLKKELLSIRVHETEGEIESLFNGYLYDSSSDEEDDESSDNDSRVDSNDSINGTNSNSNTNKNPNMEKTKVYEESAFHADNLIDEGSTSCIGHGVNDCMENIPVTDNLPPTLACDTNDNISQVKSNHSFGVLCKPKTPTGLSITSNNNNTTHEPNTKAQTPSPHEPTCTLSPTRSRIQPKSTFTRRSASVPPNHPNNSRRKRFLSMKLIHPINGIKNCASQTKKTRGKPKTRAQPTQSFTDSDDCFATSDSLSKIQRCNLRLLSKPCVSLNSESHEVNNTIHVGNQIGFEMNGKECDLERILANASWALPTTGPPAVGFKNKLKRLKLEIKKWRIKIQQAENSTSCELRMKIDNLDNKAEQSPLSPSEVELRISSVKQLADIELLKYAKTGCKDKCGNMTIPYPFGIGKKCSLNKWYNIDCKSSTPFISALNNLEIVGIDLENQIVTVKMQKISACNQTNKSVHLGSSPFL
ncbi:wall-associated receptor kinase [Artemisia annua]|uniref:Wall-associated receptor kinase n=1 Tax=Artemisia annua TaxID=35608 RepID=A0A2U1KZP9_ARTAN|nr:wall-associated receptor kinase [Artemisia annua]